MKICIIIIILAVLFFLIERMSVREEYNNILMDDVLFYIMNNDRANTSKMSVICSREYTEEIVSREISDLIDSGYIEANAFHISGKNYKRYTVKKITEKGWEYIDRKGMPYWKKIAS